MGYGKGGLRAALPFSQIWSCDFEYGTDENQRPRPVCMVARELWSGTEARIWREELLGLQRAPFATGEGALFVAYAAHAELSCFVELGWPLPQNVLDLYVEYRLLTNDELPKRNRLIDALARYGIPHIEVADKERMRALAMDQTEWTAEERVALLGYCASDVVALEVLLPHMVPQIHLGQACLRGRFMGAVARMEAVGIPIDVEAHDRLVRNWKNLRAALIAEVDAAYGVFVKGAFSQKLFLEYVERERLIWPKLSGGRPDLKDATFSDLSKAYPQLRSLWQLRRALAEMRKFALPIGADGFARCPLMPFATKTGRNAPPGSRFIFAAASWLRALIKPPEGFGLAYLDFGNQEFAVAAALTADAAMIAAYESGDPYLAFAVAAGLAPQGATKHTHGLIRDRCKVCVLGVNYGMGPETLAIQAGTTVSEAKELLRAHRRTYRQFWDWSDGIVEVAALHGHIQAKFGWRLQTGRGCKERTVRNFPAQANGAEMLRLAAIAGTEAGLSVCCTVHDAVLIMAPLDRLDADIATMRACMEQAGRAVTGGLKVRSEVAQVVRWPGRYQSDGSQGMWERVQGLLATLDASNMASGKVTIFGDLSPLKMATFPFKIVTRPIVI